MTIHSPFGTPQDWTLFIRHQLCVCVLCVVPVLRCRYGESCHGAVVVVLSHQQACHCVGAAEVHQVGGPSQRCGLGNKQFHVTSLILEHTPPNGVQFN